ncbi:DUF3300 domain-containing protein [Alishewanella sp. HH-ZS]|uniref:DUF3300 domain-containing protein n=1 Tax=Alishewanella sp. HH-ZS TaxID=1856684 RepID=UPI0008236439|nr:DUF3300 domain-containing protein [Alishewanella sp. HH-ZS]OCW96984.1 hypothetical protein A9165_08910 [Alishewanella sp. HH-ZS]
MTIQRTLPQLLLALAILLLSACASQAQSRTSNSEAELDQMLAPIALYPDSVLTHVLIASTYPLEIVQAARWLERNPDLSGEDALEAVQGQDWDPSVQALVAFPQLVQRLNDDLQWTQRLGEIFLADEPALLASIQRLRQRAYAQGSLQQMEHVVVEREREVIVIEPARREVIYVPYYDTRVVYGNWWWPAYPPLYWYEPVGHRSRVSFYWSSGFYVRPAFYFSVFDWHRHHVIVHHHYYHKPPRYYPKRQHFHNAPRWQHDHYHRRGVHYRHSQLRDRPDYQHHPDRPRRHDDTQHRPREQWRAERNQEQRSQTDNRFIPADSKLRQANREAEAAPRSAQREGRQYDSNRQPRQYEAARSERPQRQERPTDGRIVQQWAENEQRIQPIPVADTSPAVDRQRPQRVQDSALRTQQRNEVLNREQQRSEALGREQRVQYQRPQPEVRTERVQPQRFQQERVQPVSRPAQDSQRVQPQRPQMEQRQAVVSRPASESRTTGSISERSNRFENRRQQQD